MESVLHFNNLFSHNESEKDDEDNIPNNSQLFLDNMNQVFKLPITYLSNKEALNPIIIDDLELIQSKDKSMKPIYDYYFNNKNIFSSTIKNQCTDYYTTDINYLLDNQHLIQHLNNVDKNNNDNDEFYSNILSNWNDIKNNPSFLEKYQFIDWSHLEFLNHSDLFLQILSVYNLLSPIISFIAPIIILLLPFFYINAKGLQLTFEEYLEILKGILQQYSFGKLIINYKSLSPSELATCVLSFLFYLFSIYQNVLTCIKFYYNMHSIHQYIHSLTKYTTWTLNRINAFLIVTTTMNSFSLFNKELLKQKSILETIQKKLVEISELQITNFKKIFEIGKTLRTFYELYKNETFNNCFIYTFGFNGYYDLIIGIRENIHDKKMNWCSFNNNNNAIQLDGNYYAAHKDTSFVPNDISINQNMIITGPNASGKTTILKSVLLNILFSQQFGCGFYQQCQLQPFKYLWCYLNIPDTSGRDSLFQAEARRCKLIIDKLEEDKESTHFCIFDEIYSGTNPDEAIKSAKSFVDYLLLHKNTKFLLTTHYYKLTKQYKKHNTLHNYHMVTKKSESSIIYTYHLKKGISRVKGGLQILSDLNYPKEILDRNK